MANLSIVDYLKSKGQDSSVGSRAKLAVQYGIAKSEDEYLKAAAAGTNAQMNIGLLSAVQKPVSQDQPELTAKVAEVSKSVQDLVQRVATEGITSDFSKVNNNEDATKIINQNQASDISNANASGAPPVKNTANIDTILSGAVATPKTSAQTIDDLVSNLTKIKTALAPSTAKPATPDFETQMTTYRTKYGLDALEKQMTDLQAEEANIQAAKRQRIAAERGKVVATNVIEGRVSTVERQENERIDAIQRQATNISNQINTKNKVIETYMKLTDMDYDNAVKAYESEMSNNVSMYNIVKGVSDDQKTEQERANDNARSSLQIVYNQLSSGGTKISNLTANQKTLISKLELQAGLPVGFYETLQNKNPKAEIITTKNWTDASNNEYVSVISKDGTTGALTTQNILLGKAKTTTTTDKTTDAEMKIYYKTSMAGELNKAIGKDGYISPDDWNKALKAWPYGTKDFVENFLGYINPSHSDDYAGAQQYAGF